MCNIKVSPCLNCNNKKNIPECSEKCSRLSEYQWAVVLDRKHNATPTVYTDGTGRKMPVFVR